MGEPGIEALLDQLLPKIKSLFFSYYEVCEARKEFRYLRSLIEHEGIRFTQGRDAIAQVLKKRAILNEPNFIKTLEDSLLAYAEESYQT